jgi:hypothetical protein
MFARKILFLHGMSATDIEPLTREPACLFGCEKDDNISDIYGLSETPKRNISDHFSL